MAPIPSSQNGTERADDCAGIRSDTKMRKPLVERKRRARINESLQELRLLIADTDLQSKMENAEVLEMTVRQVESILQNRTEEADAVSREACERFAAGYIQCMHDVHTFVSTCPVIDPALAAELLSHLLESMPLNAEAPEAEAGAASPAPSNASTDDLSCSDLDETDAEQSHVSSSSEEADSPEYALNPPDVTNSRSLWRPW